MKTTCLGFALVFFCALVLGVTGCGDMATTTTAGASTTVAASTATSDPNEALFREILAQRPGMDVFLPSQLPEGWHLARLGEVLLIGGAEWPVGETAEVTANPEVGILYPDPEWGVEGGTYYRVFFSDGYGMICLDLDWYLLDAIPTWSDTGLTFDGAPWEFVRYEDAPDALPQVSCSFRSGTDWHELTLLTWGSVSSGVVLYLMNHMKRYPALD